MTERAAILDAISRLRGDLKARPKPQEPAPLELDKFILLLGGVSALRKIPGIDAHMGFEELYFCPTQAQAEQVRGHLREMFDVTDQETLLDACDQMFSAGMEYAQFLTFWAEAPSFDENELEPRGKAAFSACKDYAALYRDLVGEKGFYAWDISERIGLLRAACACGIIDAREFRAIGWELARLATDVYSSWEEYALSLICGAVYFMFVQNGRQEGSLKNFCDINERCLRHLFFEEGGWADLAWYQFPQKKFALAVEEIQPLLENWDGPDGCLATDKILVEGKPVGYLYREDPAENMPGDSGWRFFAGTEDEDYLSNPDNSGVYALNTLCNCSPDILPLLSAPVGSAYFRDESGTFRAEAQ